MRKIAVFTGTRAEYGLLYWLLKDIQAEESMQLQLIVSAMHLSPEFGYSKSLIEQDGFVIDEQVEMLLSSDTTVGCVKSMGLAMIGFSDCLQRLKPDFVVILGDRFEALAMAQSAMLMNIPIAHIHGGEITEGAKDDAIRHAITKFSNLHFTANKSYAQRVRQLGENPQRIFNVGSLGVEALHRNTMMSLAQLTQDIDSTFNFKLTQPYFLITYHSVTLGDEKAALTFKTLLSVLDEWSDYQVLITFPNADDGGRQLISLIENYAKKNPQRVLAVKSLGQQRYFSAVKHSAGVIGNSSSGIIEVPSLHVPSINIGIRQKGRLSASSVVHCAATKKMMKSAIKTITTVEYNNALTDVVNPYGDSNTSEKIIRALKEFPLNETKSFYDIEVQTGIVQENNVDNSQVGSFS
jgi:UDP-hydrolysing UDP-N-acetyl-D-glucosamine 2-epimerase